MKKVNLIYKEETVLVNEVEKGICISECNDIVIPLTIEEISNLLEKYNNDDEINLKINFVDFLEDNGIGWEYVVDGYFTEKEFIEKYKDEVLINMVMDEVLDAQGYYDWYEEIYFYSYWDGSNHQTIVLEDEGEEVIYIAEVEKKNTYEIDLYYNIDEKEIFTVYNSYFQGDLLTPQIDCDIEEDTKATIEKIEKLLEKINHAIENNNKCSDKHEGFKITINVNDDEFETFNYISSLYDWYEREGNELYITKQYED